MGIRIQGQQFLLALCNGARIPYTQGWDWCSGYYLTDTSMMGFSHTHLGGTGCGDMLDVLLMPNVGEMKWESGMRENYSGGYRAMFFTTTSRWSRATMPYYSKTGKCTQN
jgi:putative alpha-1,2-mannosidase